MLHGREGPAQLLEQALTLPAPKRAALAGDLLDTLDTPEGVEAAWTTELRDGCAELIDWKTARTELHGTNQ